MYTYLLSAYHVPGSILDIILLQQNRHIICPHEAFNLGDADNRYLNGQIYIFTNIDTETSSIIISGW